MGRDRPWNAKFPEHLRRSRSRKPKWQKKLKSKERDLLQNLEKVENRIFATRQQEKMRKARNEARLELQGADFPQGEEPAAAPRPSAPERRERPPPLVPRLEDPEDDIFLPSEDSSDDRDSEDDAAQQRRERQAERKAAKRLEQDPLGLDEGSGSDGEGRPPVASHKTFRGAHKMSGRGRNGPSIKSELRRPDSGGSPLHGSASKKRKRDGESDIASAKKKSLGRAKGPPSKRTKT